MKWSVLRRSLIVVLLAALGAASVRCEVRRRDLAPGVVFQQEVVPPPDGPLVWNVLRVDPKAPGIRIQAALGRDAMLTDEPAKGRETVGELAARRGALAAVNADFFPFTGRPLGLTVVDGEVVAEGLPYRAVLGLTADGQVRFDRLTVVATLRGPKGDEAAVTGINRLPEKDGLTLLTPVFGARARASSALTVAELGGVSGPLRAGVAMEAVVVRVHPGDPAAPIAAGTALLAGDGSGAQWLQDRLRPGDRVSVRVDLASSPDGIAPERGGLASRAASRRAGTERSAWADVVQAVGGGPWLVRGSRIAVDGAQEGFSEREFVEARHPRTAAGVTASGELLLVTVDGRQPHSRGASLSELARYLVGLGATDAINLDGGGSTTMVVHGLYVNGPSDGAPRPVADALLVLGPASPDAVKRDAPPLTAVAGGRAQFDTGGADALFGTLEGRAFVDQAGVLSSTRASAGTVVAWTRDLELRAPYRILPGAAARLVARLEKAPNDPPDRSVLSIAAVDAYGNGVPGVCVQIGATGGAPERAEAVTGDTGRVEIEIVWDADAGRAATVRAEGLKSVRVTPAGAGRRP